MAEDRFDGLFSTVAQQAQGIEALFDVFFGFLQRKTDFFTGNVDHEECRRIVMKYYDKHSQAAELRKDEIRQRNTQLDEERRQRITDGKKREAEEFRRQQAELAQRPKVEELEENDEAGQKAESLQNKAENSDPTIPHKQPNSATTPVEPVEISGDADASIAEADNDDTPPPSGNGGKTDKYIWTQTLSALELQIPVPPCTKSRDCIVDIGGSKLKVGIRGKPATLDGKLHAKVKPDDCMWTLVDNKMIQLSLEKHDGMRWWSCVLEGDPEIDTKKIVPENSKLSDLDPETRSTVEKMMFDQRQKAAGLPTSDQLKQAELLDKFKAAHPEMDFSNAKINWGGGNSFG